MAAAAAPPANDEEQLGFFGRLGRIVAPVEAPLPPPVPPSRSLLGSLAQYVAPNPAAAAAADGEMTPADEGVEESKSTEPPVSESTPDDETTSRCVICMASQSDHRCIPSGHVVFCGSCARDPRLDRERCPVCRERVEGMQRVEARPRGAAVAGDRPERAARAAGAASDTKYLLCAAAALAAAAAVLVLRKKRIT